MLLNPYSFAFRRVTEEKVTHGTSLFDASGAEKILGQEPLEGPVQRRVEVELQILIVIRLVLFVGGSPEFQSRVEGFLGGSRLLIGLVG